MCKQSRISLIGVFCSFFGIAFVCAQAQMQFDYQGLLRISAAFANLKAENKLTILKRDDKGGEVSFSPVSTNKLREPFLASNMVIAVKGLDNVYLGDIKENGQKYKILLCDMHTNIIVVGEYKLSNGEWIKVQGK